MARQSNAPIPIGLLNSHPIRVAGMIIPSPHPNFTCSLRRVKERRIEQLIFSDLRKLDKSKLRLWARFVKRPVVDVGSRDIDLSSASLTVFQARDGRPSKGASVART
jgi:hypothetical protein